MTDFYSLYRREPDLYFITNFTESYNMKKDNYTQATSLEELRLKLASEELSKNDQLKIQGGKTFERDKWQSGCGGIAPQ